MPLVPDPKYCDISVKRAIQGLSNKLGYTGSPTFANTYITNVITASTSVFSKTCTLAAGLNVLRVTGLQTDATALTGTLRGGYIDVSNGALDATGTIRALELKARTEAPGDTGNDVAILEGLSISADSKGHGVTTMRAAEFILDGSLGGTIDEAVGLRIANNLQADKATLSYGLQIYRDSFDYTYDISLSLGGYITGDSYVNQDVRTTATPTFNGLLSTGVVQATDFAKTGWPVTPGVTLSFVGGTTRTFTVTDDDSAYYYIDGVKYTLGENKTVVITDTEGLWYIYFDGDTLTASQTIWSFRDEDKALVAMLYWDATNNKEIFLGWETHTFHIDGSTHARLHYAGGARWETGLLVSDNLDNTVDVSAGDIWDEDLNIPITDDDTPTALFEQILSPARLPIYYRDGASTWRIYEIGDKAAVTDVGYLSGGDLKWNDATTTWSNETVGLNNYVAYYVVATNEQAEPVALIMGQRVDNKLTEAQANNVFAGLSLAGLPFQEMVVLARLILKDTATYTLEEVLDLRAYNIKGNITSPLITQHAGLGGLNWSSSGHYFDAEVDFNAQNITNIGTVSCGVITQSGTTLANTYQPVHANLTSLATLTYTAASFVKMTGANTFALRTIGETANDLQGTIDHDLTANYVADKHVAHAGVSITAGKGLSGGGTIASTRDIALDLTEMTGNVVWDDGSTDASITWTYALSGANDPVWTIGSNSMDLTTGVLKVGGTTVMLVGGAPTAHLHDGDVLEHDGVDSSAGAFPFDTDGIVTFSNAITMSAGMDLTIAGHIIFNTDNSYIGFTNPKITFNDTGNQIEITGGLTGTSTAAFAGASVTIGTASTTTGTLVLHDSGSANTITLTVPNALAGSLTFTLPPTDGDNTEVLQTNGSGVLTWVANAGGGTWISLTDTDPANYTDDAGKCVVVNAGEDGLEFGAFPGISNLDGGSSATVYSGVTGTPIDGGSV